MHTWAVPGALFFIVRDGSARCAHRALYQVEIHAYVILRGPLDKLEVRWIDER